MCEHPLARFRGIPLFAIVIKLMSTCTHPCETTKVLIHTCKSWCWVHLRCPLPTKAIRCNLSACPHLAQQASIAMHVPRHLLKPTDAVVLESGVRQPGTTSDKMSRLRRTAPTTCEDKAARNDEAHRTRWTLALATEAPRITEARREPLEESTRCHRAGKQNEPTDVFECQTVSRRGHPCNGVDRSRKPAVIRRSGSAHTHTRARMRDACGTSYPLRRLHCRLHVVAAGKRAPIQHLHATTFSPPQRELCEMSFCCNALHDCSRYPIRFVVLCQLPTTARGRGRAPEFRA